VRQEDQLRRRAPRPLLLENSVGQGQQLRRRAPRLLLLLLRLEPGSAFQS